MGAQNDINHDKARFFIHTFKSNIHQLPHVCIPKPCLHLYTQRYVKKGNTRHARAYDFDYLYPNCSKQQCREYACILYALSRKGNIRTPGNTRDYNFYMGTRNNYRKTKPDFLIHIKDMPPKFPICLYRDVMFCFQITQIYVNERTPEVQYCCNTQYTNTGSL